MMYQNLEILWFTIFLNHGVGCGFLLFHLFRVLIEDLCIIFMDKLFPHNMQCVATLVSGNFCLQVKYGTKLSAAGKSYATHTLIMY